MKEEELIKEIRKFRAVANKYRYLLKELVDNLEEEKEDE